MDNDSPLPATPPPSSPAGPGQPGATPGQHLPPGGPAGQPIPGPPPRRPRGKRRILIVALIVVALCAGLCGVGQLITNVLNQDDWEGLGEPVPAATLPATPTPSWKPPNEFVNPQPVLRIRHQLEVWVLASAGVTRPMTSGCDDDEFTGEQAATFRCTVTYDGRDVVYTISARPAGSGTFEWDGEAKETVVTREGLLALVHRRFGASGWKDLRCEEFPELAVVPVGQDMSQFCYAKMDGAIKTSKIMIAPTDQAEPRLQTEHQEEGLR
ncbi:hypothetical protein WEI85_41835 [Actinomycetes bacterium KLBMP 9797]